MKKAIEKWIVRKLYEHNMLVFETHKSPTQFDQETRVLFCGKLIHEIKWSRLEIAQRGLPPSFRL